MRHLDQTKSLAAERQGAKLKLKGLGNVRMEGLSNTEMVQRRPKSEGLNRLLILRERAALAFRRQGCGQALFEIGIASFDRELEDVIRSQDSSGIVGLEL